MKMTITDLWHRLTGKSPVNTNDSQDNDSKAEWENSIYWRKGEIVVYADMYHPAECYLMKVKQVVFVSNVATYLELEGFDTEDDMFRLVSLDNADPVSGILIDKNNKRAMAISVKAIPENFNKEYLDVALSDTDEVIESARKSLEKYRLFDEMDQKRDFDSFLRYYIEQERLSIANNRSAEEERLNMVLRLKANEEKVVDFIAKNVK